MSRRYFVQWNKAPEGQTLQQRFNVEDVDKSGFITPNEFGGE